MGPLVTEDVILIDFPWCAKKMVFWLIDYIGSRSRTVMNDHYSKPCSFTVLVVPSGQLIKLNLVLSFKKNRIIYTSMTLSNSSNFSTLCKIIILTFLYFYKSGGMLYCFSLFWLRTIQLLCNSENTWENVDHNCKW